MANIFDRLTARPESVETVDSTDEERRDVDRDRAPAGPVSYTPRQVKEVALELLKYGLLEEQRKPNLYRTALAEHAALGRVLEPLDLAMRVDEIRGLVYVVVADQVFDSVEGEWSHPLVRRQRLNLEPSSAPPAKQAISQPRPVWSRL